MKKTLVIMLIAASLAVAGTVDVLVYGAGAENLFQTLLARLRVDDRIGEVGFHDASESMLYWQDFAEWGVVLVDGWNANFFRPIVAGNELARYVDGGGVVILAGISFFGPGGRSLAGDIIAPPYSPLTQGSTSGVQMDTEWIEEGHPVFEGIDPWFVDVRWQILLELTDCGVLLALYDYIGYDLPELAVNENENVVGLNLLLADVWGPHDGDEWGLVRNVCAWLGDYSPDPAVTETTWGAIKALNR